MTIFNINEGRRVTVYRKLANTTPVALYQPNVSETVVVLDSLVASCRSGGSTFDLYVTDGTSSFYIAEGKAISANDQFILKDHHIALPNSDYSLMFKDITGNKIDVSAVMFIPMQKNAPRQ